MQTYLKTRPVGVQLLQFLAMIAGSFFIIGLTGTVLFSLITGVSLESADNIAAAPVAADKKLFFMRGLLLTQFLVFTIPVFIFAKLSDKQPMHYLGLQLPKKRIYWVLGVISLLVAIPLVDFTGLLNSKINFGESMNSWIQRKKDSARAQLTFILSKRGPVNLIFNIICMALFAGIGEELIFRGVLQRLLINGTKSPWAGIIISAFLFSFIHFQFFGFIPRFLLGILLGAVYWYSGSLWTAIVAHFIYDAFIIAAIYLQPAMLEHKEATLVDTSYLWITAIISAVLVMAMVRWMRQLSTASYEQVYANDDAAPSDQKLSF